MMDGERTYCTSTGEIYIMNDKILKVRRYTIMIMVSRLDLTVNLQLYKLTFQTCTSRDSNQHHKIVTLEH